MKDKDKKTDTVKTGVSDTTLIRLQKSTVRRIKTLQAKSFLAGKNETYDTLINKALNRMVIVLIVIILETLI